MKLLRFAGRTLRRRQSTCSTWSCRTGGHPCQLRRRNRASHTVRLIDRGGVRYRHGARRLAPRHAPEYAAGRSGDAARHLDRRSPDEVRQEVRAQPLSHRAGTMAAMNRTLELWRWSVTDPVSRRRYVTRCRMTEADALDLDPAAEHVPGSQELRQVSTDPMVNSTSGWQRR